MNLRLCCVPFGKRIFCTFAGLFVIIAKRSVVVDETHELGARGGVVPEITDKATGDHMSLFACAPTFLAHMPSFEHERDTLGRVFRSERLLQHVDDVARQTFLNLETLRAIIHYSANLGESENTSLWIRDIGKIVLTKDGATMVFTERVEVALVNNHVVVDDAVPSILESGDCGFTSGVVASENLVEHAEHAVGCSLKSLASGVITNVFEQFNYVLPCLLFCYHVVI